MCMRRTVGDPTQSPPTVLDAITWAKDTKCLQCKILSQGLILVGPPSGEWDALHVNQRNIWKADYDAWLRVQLNSPERSSVASVLLSFVELADVPALHGDCT
jgi:hypothetical protein